MEKVSGEDKVPSRLVKMASNFLFESITHIINTAVDTDTFPDRAKHIYLINDLFLFIKKASTMLIIVLYVGLQPALMT